MKKVLGSTAIALVVPLLHWLGGYEFVRGEAMFYTGLITIAVFISAITCPFWDFKWRL